MDGAAANASSGQLLASTEAQLRARREALEPLLDVYDEVHDLLEALDGSGRPATGVPGLPVHAKVLKDLQRMEKELRAWSEKLAPLVREHEQIGRVLAAFQSASRVEVDAAQRRRPRAPRSPSAGLASRLDELRDLLHQERSRADLANSMSLSPSRITELLEPLVRSGEVEERRDPMRPTRKLYARRIDTDPEASGRDLPPDQGV